MNSKEKNKKEKNFDLSMRKDKRFIYDSLANYQWITDELLVIHRVSQVNH